VDMPELVARWAARQHHRIVTVAASGSSQAALSALAESHLVRDVHVWRLPAPTVALDALHMRSADVLCGRAMLRACSRHTTEAWACSDSTTSDVLDFLSSASYRTGTLQQIVRLNRILADSRDPVVPAGTSVRAIATRTALTAVASAVSSTVAHPTGADAAPPTPAGKLAVVPSSPPNPPPDSDSANPEGQKQEQENEEGTEKSDETAAVPPTATSARAEVSTRSTKVQEVRSTLISLYGDGVRAVLSTRYLQSLGSAMCSDDSERDTVQEAVSSPEGLPHALFRQTASAAKQELQSSLIAAMGMQEDPTDTEAGHPATEALRLADQASARPLDPVELMTMLLLAPAAPAAAPLGISALAVESLKRLLTCVPAVPEVPAADSSGMSATVSAVLVRHVRQFIGELALSLVLSGTVMVADSSGVVAALLCPPTQARNIGEPVWGLLPGVRVSETTLPRALHTDAGGPTNSTQDRSHSILECRLFGDDRIVAVQGDGTSTFTTLLHMCTTLYILSLSLLTHHLSLTPICLLAPLATCLRLLDPPRDDSGVGTAGGTAALCSHGSRFCSCSGKSECEGKCRGRGASSR